jgi:hypothetical protein
VIQRLLEKKLLSKLEKLRGLIGGVLGAKAGAAVGAIVIGVAGGTVGLPVLVVLGVAGVVFTLGGGYLGGVTGATIAEYSYERLK